MADIITEARKAADILAIFLSNTNGKAISKERMKSALLALHDLSQLPFESFSTQGSSEIRALRATIDSLNSAADKMTFRFTSVEDGEWEEEARKTLENLIPTAFESLDKFRTFDLVQNGVVASRNAVFGIREVAPPTPEELAILQSIIDNKKTLDNVRKAISSVLTFVQSKTLPISV